MVICLRPEEWSQLQRALGLNVAEVTRTGGREATSKGGRIGDLRKNVQERLDGTALP